MSLSIVNRNTLTNNLTPYNLDQQKLASSLILYSKEEVYQILIDCFQKNTISPFLSNAFASVLSKDFSSLSPGQLIKLTEIFVKLNSTHSIFNKLFEFYEQHANISLEEIVSLLVICQELETAEVKLPPNQVVVNFLRSLKSKLLNMLKANNLIVREIHRKLKNSEYSEEKTAAILDALLHLGSFTKLNRSHLEKSCQLALSKYAQRNDLSIELYLRIYMLQASLLSIRQVWEQTFYESDPLYKSNTPKIQRSVNDIKLEDIAALVKKSVSGGLRDPGLLRTLSRRAFNLLEKSVLELDQICLIIKILEGYAQLNRNTPVLLDLCYRKVVCHRINLEPDDALRLLYGTAIFGLIGSSTSKVKKMVASINQNVNSAIADLDPIKLELIKLFVKAFAPKLITFRLNTIKKCNASFLGNVSIPQQVVSDFLTSRGLQHQCEGFAAGYPNPVDIIIYKSDNPQLKADTVIEIDGPHHLDISGMKYRGKDVLKNYLLSQRWKVIRLRVDQTDLNRLEEIMKEICKEFTPF